MTERDLERTVAAFAAEQLGREVTRVVRVDAFVTNAVFAVDAGECRCVVKASKLHDALRAEAWACARGADTGCAAPEVLGFGRLAVGDTSAFLMPRVDGSPIAAGHPAFPALGAGLRRLHDVRPPRFGWLAGASWDARGDFSLPHRSWLDFLNGICADTRTLADAYELAAPVAEAASAAIDARARALAAVEMGSLCHGDLKPAHILVDAGRLAGVIDWGDAVVADPVWDLARFAHRAEGETTASLVDAYDPERAMADELAWRIPLYEALWMLVDAVIAHRLLGRRADAVLGSAMRLLASCT
jgi:aminoglycoside phosphotransferase (APT) family kinase protein